MRRLTLTNFRGFASLDRDLDRPLTVLVGVNGSGKSSVLRALSEVQTELAKRYPDKTFPAEGLRRLREKTVSPPSGSLRPFAGYLAWWLDRAIRKRSAA